MGTEKLHHSAAGGDIGEQTIDQQRGADDLQEKNQDTEERG